jgi:hypothetical protein
MIVFRDVRLSWRYNVTFAAEGRRIFANVSADPLGVEPQVTVSGGKTVPMSATSRRFRSPG